MNGQTLSANGCVLKSHSNTVKIRCNVNKCRRVTMQNQKPIVMPIIALSGLILMFTLAAMAMFRDTSWAKYLWSFL